MKKAIALLLILLMSFECLTAFAAEPSDVKSIVNGVTVVLVEKDRVVKPIQEDGVLYIPLVAFLDALGIPFTQSEGTISISLSDTRNTTPAPTPTKTPTPYELLSGEERTFMETFLIHVSKFYDPSSVSFVEIYKGAGSHKYGFYVKVSAANKLGGKVFNWYFVNSSSFDGYKYAPSSGEYTASNFDISKMNKALKYKLEDMGY